MPHIVIEHSDRAEVASRIPELMDALETAYSADTVIVPAHVKMRALPYSATRVSGGDGPFVHIRLELMAGRSADDLSRTADTFHRVALETFPDVRQVTFDLRELAPATYRKRPAQP